MPSPPRSTPAPEPPDPYADVPMSDSLRALARRGGLRRLRKGVQIITEGDRGDTLYIVLAGRLRAFSVGSDDREVIYGTYGAGEYVGEMGLDGGLRSANVVTLEASVCALVTRQTLQQHLDEDPHFAFELLSKVISRARVATLNLRQIALLSVYGRLKDLLENITAAPAGGSRVADPAPSHAEISQTLGCGREMVSRVMKDLARGGYVECARRRIVLLKPLPAKW